MVDQITFKIAPFRRALGTDLTSLPAKIATAYTTAVMKVLNEGTSDIPGFADCVKVSFDEAIKAKAIDTENRPELMRGLGLLAIQDSKYTLSAMAYPTLRMFLLSPANGITANSRKFTCTLPKEFEGFIDKLEGRGEPDGQVAATSANSIAVITMADFILENNTVCAASNTNAVATVINNFLSAKGTPVSKITSPEKGMKDKGAISIESYTSIRQELQAALASRTAGPIVTTLPDAAGMMEYQQKLISAHSAAIW